MGGLNDGGQRTPELVILSMIVALVAGSLLLGGSDSEKKKEPASVASLPSERRIVEIEREVERLRGVKFEKRVVPKVVTDKEAAADQLGEADRSYPEDRQRSDEELLKLLGLLPPGADIRKVLTEVAEGQVIGYYNTRNKQLRLVSGSGADAPVLVEITLAHEMTHALEDQRFGLNDEEAAGGADDEASARQALHEGTAQKITTDFSNCCVDPGDLLTGSLTSLGGDNSLSKLPPYVQRSLLFPYREGEQFVSYLHDAADGWKLVDLALQEQPPQSTEQILHPEKFAPPEPPLKVKLDVKPVIGPGWKKSNTGTLGEFDTAELLRLDPGNNHAEGAAGWGGGAYELWQREGKPPPECKPPCRERDALVLGWRWDTAADAREFEPQITRYVTTGLKGKLSGEGERSVGKGAAVLTTGPRSTTLVFAPDSRLGRRLAERGVSSP